MTIWEKLLRVQVNLKVKKERYNNFGTFYYRTTEDILNALKPLLLEVRAVITFNDSVEEINGKRYVKSTLYFTDVDPDGKQIMAVAYAREEDEKKKFDGAQLTGAASSYARKYALNAMFSIDDSTDPDVTNVGEDKEAEEMAKQIAFIEKNTEFASGYLKTCLEKAGKEKLSELHAPQIAKIYSVIRNKLEEQKGE